MNLKERSMKSYFVAYGFEQLNQIRDCVIEGESNNESQEEILADLVRTFVNMTNKKANSLTINEFVTELFVNSIKIAYHYFQQSDSIGLSDCTEVINQMAVYAKDLSFYIEDEQDKKTFYVSSYITKRFIEGIIKSSKPNKIIILDHPIFVANYDIEKGNLKEIIDGISKF